MLRKILILSLAGLLPLEAAIELVTVPKSQSVQLTIYNSADLTMVRERRQLTFRKGLNKLQFSWAGTLIDPTSLRLTFISARDNLDLQDTSFPPGRTDALQWNIISEMNGPATVEISYFTSGITWSADYAVFTDNSEKSMRIKGYVRVINNSGEDYPDAHVRLVVGTVNLVESIADLARGSWRYQELNEEERESVRDSFKKKVKRAERPSRKKNGKANGGFDDEGEMPSAPVSEQKKEIVKEGLSEYFLFSIEGQETIPNGWQKRLSAFEADDVPVEVIYRRSDKTTGGEVHKFYEFRNEKQKDKTGNEQLGLSPMPDGKVQIFKEDDQKNLRYMGSVNIPYAATGDKVILNTGYSGDVIVKNVIKDYKRVDIETERNYNAVYVKSYTEKFLYETTVENTLNRKVKVEIEVVFADKFELSDADFKYKKMDSSTLKFFPETGADSKKKYTYTIRVFRR